MTRRAGPLLLAFLQVRRPADAVSPGQQNEVPALALQENTLRRLSLL